MTDRADSDRKRAPGTAEDIGPADAGSDQGIQRGTKEEIALELDDDILAWFYQYDDPEAAINDALIEYIERQQAQAD